MGVCRAYAAQRIAVQRRAVEIGITVSTKSLSKIAPISGRVARPLQWLVRRVASINGIRKPLYSNHIRLVHAAELRDQCLFVCLTFAQMHPDWRQRLLIERDRKRLVQTEATVMHHFDADVALGLTLV
jgi:hypothetical protein